MQSPAIKFADKSIWQNDKNNKISLIVFILQAFCEQQKV